MREYFEVLSDERINDYITNAKMAEEEFEIKAVTMDLITKRASIQNKAIKLNNIKPAYTIRTMNADGFHYHDDRYIELKAGRNKIKYHFSDCHYKEDDQKAVFRFYNYQDDYKEDMRITIQKQ